MELRQIVIAAVPGSIRYTGEGNFTVAAEEHLEIKGEEDILDIAVPAGKTWRVRIELRIDEI